MDKRGVGIDEFVVAGGDASELLEVVEEPLHLVAVPVGKRVKIRRLPAVWTGWHHGHRAGFSDLSAQGVGVVGRVGVGQYCRAGANRDVRKSSACGASPAWPAVRVEASRPPASSLATCSLMGKPLRLRPSA